MRIPRLSHCLTMLITATVVVFSVLTIRIAADTRVKEFYSAQPLVSTSATAKAPIDVAIMPADEDAGLWLTLRASGFETKDLTITAGDYLLVVQNATGLDEVDLRLERASGERLYETHLPREKKHWRQAVHFTAGTYVVSEVGHSDWTSHITVTAAQ